jgi:hypothetical protein
MSFGCVRTRHITHRWMTLSLGGLQFIDGCNTTAGTWPENNFSRRWGIDFRSSLFSTKDLIDRSTLSTIVAKKKDSNDPTEQPPQSLPASKAGLDRASLNAPLLKEENRTRLIGKDKASVPSAMTSKNNDGKRRDEARRIVVKRSAVTNDNSDIISDPFALRQRVGLVSRRFPLEHEIMDSGGKTIWIPAREMIENDSVIATQFPQINGAAWLDPATYCRGGGKSIAGTAAARQLLRGKKDLMEVLGHAIYSASSKLVKAHRSIVLIGNGLPPQILQHHIDTAASLLHRLDASEISFKQFNVSQRHNYLASSEAVREIRWGHVRDFRTGENLVVTWPIDDESHWADDLQLYWTVMNRIATRLGLAVLLKRPQLTQLSETSTRRPRADYSLPGNSMLNTPPHHWRVKFSRELHFLPEQLPSNRYQLYPIVEWTPLDGVAAPGHVCIRLQGESIGNDGTLPISLCFDAFFRNNISTSYENG